MNKKGKIILLILVLLISIGVGYLIMSITNKNIEIEEPTPSTEVVRPNNFVKLSDLEFKDSVYDVDGMDEENRTTVKIYGSKLIIEYNENTYEIEEFIPKSVRINYTNLGEGYNIIYVLSTDGELYKFKDTDLETVVKNKYIDIMEKINIVNVEAFSTYVENDISKGYFYPLLCVKSDTDYYISKYNEEFYKLEDENAVITEFTASNM